MASRHTKQHYSPTEYYRSYLNGKVLSGFCSARFRALHVQQCECGARVTIHTFSGVLVVLLLTASNNTTSAPGRRPGALSCILNKMRCTQSMHPLFGALPVPCVPAIDTRGGLC